MLRVSRLHMATVLVNTFGHLQVLRMSLKQVMMIVHVTLVAINLFHHLLEMTSIASLVTPYMTMKLIYIPWMLCGMENSVMD